MMYKTHAMFGATFAAGAMLLLKQPLMPIGIGLAAFTALLPDMDHPQSMASNMNPLMVVIAFLFRIVTVLISLVFNLLKGLLGLLGIRLADSTSSHRGPLTHSPLGSGVIFGVLFLPLLFFGTGWWYAAAMLGVASHIFADSLNPEGTMWFWPFTSGRHRFIPKPLAPTTGKFGEDIAFLLVLAVFFGVVLAGTYGPGVSFQDASKFWAPAAGLKLSLGGGKAQDTALAISELPKGVMRMPDGSLYFTDGTPVSLKELQRRSISMPKGWDGAGLVEQGKAAGQDTLNGMKPVTDLIGGALQDNPVGK